MAVPTYKQFIDPILRYLALQQSSVPARDAHEAAALVLRLSEADRAEQLESGGPLYKSRAAWAFNRLKHAGLASAPTVGTWQLTPGGREFATANPSLSADQIDEIADIGSKSRPANPRRLRAAPAASLPTDRGNRKAYKLPAHPLATGGQAEVYEAVRKADNKKFVLKRVKGPSGKDRMRREIQVQSSLIHPNVMPLVDWATDFSWFVMPLGVRTMSSLTPPLQQDLILQIVGSVSVALDFAHKAGHPHRDVKPDNIIELADDKGVTRWVLADWGLTRRPLGETTAGLTNTGHLLGTPAYAPPEAYLDGHTVGPPGDIYSLAKVIAWAIGVEPIPNVAPVVAEPWRELVERMTKSDPAERIQTIEEVQAMLTTIFPVPS